MSHFDNTPKGFFWHKATKGRNIHLVNNHKVHYQGVFYEQDYTMAECGFVPKEYPGWHGLASDDPSKYCKKCRDIADERAPKEPLG